MRQKLLLSIIAGIIVVSGVAALSAYEAHVINVTAKIENALRIIPPNNDFAFGTVFPQEYFQKSLIVTTSDSFCETDQTRVLQIDYKIVQKPKPIWPIPVECTALYPDATLDEARAYCHANPTDLDCCYPSLCPYLSKLLRDEDPEPYTDYGVAAFHDPNEPSSIATGTIHKYYDLWDEWLIDLNVPCFEGMCAQEWTHYGWELDPNLESETFGCDLWLEVTGISTGINEKEQACLDSDGTLDIRTCCLAVGDFPNTCGNGACACAPENSHEVKFCDCGPDKCFNGSECLPVS